MFGREIWDKLPECVFEFPKITRMIYPKKSPEQTINLEREDISFIHKNCPSKTMANSKFSKIAIG